MAIALIRFSNGSIRGGSIVQEAIAWCKQGLHFGARSRVWRGLGQRISGTARLSSSRREAVYYGKISGNSLVNGILWRSLSSNN